MLLNPTVAEAVSAVRNSISSGHNILSTIHADKASAIPYRMYSLMETDLDVNQFLNTIYRYIQIGVHIKAYYSKELGKFHREVDEVNEIYPSSYRLSVAYGISVFDEDIHKIVEDVFIEADERMYKRKSEIKSKPENSWMIRK